MSNNATELALLLYANIKNFMTNIARAEREMKKVGESMMKTGKTLSAGVTLPLIGLGTAAVASSMKMESLRKGLTAVAGSAEAADAQFQRLKEVAKLPGLGLEEAVQGSVNLQAAGFSAEQAERSLMAFGNALATVGKGKAELDGVILALGQIQSKGKISAEEINQLAERVPQIRQIMVTAFGTAVPEAIQKSGVTAEQFVTKVTDELLKLPQVTGGLGNAWENLGDATKVSLGKIGDTIANAFDLENTFNKIAESLQGVAHWFENLSPAGQKAVVGIGAVLAAVGPLSIGIGFFVKSVVPNMVAGLNAIKVAFTAMTGPIGIIIAAVAALAAGVIAFSGKTDAATQSQKNFAEISKEVSSAVGSEKLRLDALLSVAKDETKSRKERQRALDEAIKISPDYLNTLSLDKINTQDATKAVDEYIKSFKRKIELQASEKKYAELQEKIKATEEERSNLIQKAQGTIFGGFASPKIASLAEEINSLNTQATDLENNIKKIVEQDVVGQVNTGTSTTGTGVTDTKDAITELRSSLKILESEYQVFGDAIDLNSEKQELYTKAIKDLISEGVSPASAQIAKLRGELEELQAQAQDPRRNQITNSGIGPIQSLGTTGLTIEPPAGLISSAGAIQQVQDKIADSVDAQKQKVDDLNATYQQLGSTIGNVFAQALQDTDNFANAALNAVIQSVVEIIKALIAQAIAGWVAANIATMGPLGLAAAAAGPAIIGGLFDSLVPKLAQGGITTGPTLAMIGDNPSGRELVLPLEKAKGFFNDMGGARVQVYGRISGQDILLSSDRAARSEKRNGGRR